MTTTGTIEVLLDQAEAALDEGDAETTLRLCDAVERQSPGHPGAAFVRGDALRALGQLEAAADAYQQAALARSDHTMSWSALALARFELLEIEQSARAVSRALREDPRNPEAWWVRSLIQEWNGDLNGARRARLHARWLNPHDFPLPPSLTDDEIETIVSDCIESLHPQLQEYLASVAILLDDLPDESLLRKYDPPMSPLELLGHFSGYSLMGRSFDDPWSNIPPSIVLFRQNLERYSAHREELIEQLRITVFHEVGHFLGLDEDDVEARGLE
jgi:predicted Zn-dependent protease with MMP-like domain